MTKTLTLRSFDIPQITKFGIGFDNMFDLPRYRRQNILQVVINKELINTPMTLIQENS